MMSDQKKITKINNAKDEMETVIENQYEARQFKQGDELSSIKGEIESLQKKGKLDEAIELLKQNGFIDD